MFRLSCAEAGPPWQGPFQSKMSAPKLHEELYLHQLGNLVRIQPAEGGPALTIELKSCTIGLSDASLPLQSESSVQRIYGVIGLQALIGGSALAVITGIKEVRLQALVSCCGQNRPKDVIGCLLFYR